MQEISLERTSSLKRKLSFLEEKLGQTFSHAKSQLLQNGFERYMRLIFL